MKVGRRLRKKGRTKLRKRNRKNKDKVKRHRKKYFMPSFEAVVRIASMRQFVLSRLDNKSVRFASTRKSIRLPQLDHSQFCLNYTTSPFCLDWTTSQFVCLSWTTASFASTTPQVNLLCPPPHMTTPSSSAHITERICFSAQPCKLSRYVNVLEPRWLAEHRVTSKTLVRRAAQ
jgi:hypothetical protein